MTLKSMLRVGSSTSMRGRAVGQLGVGDRVADLDGGQADDRDDVAGLGLLDLDSAQLVEEQHAVDRRRARSTPPALSSATCWPRLTEPEKIRPMAIRPT